ncbi:MAG: flagellar motor protein MotA [Methylococcaceae bacterium]|nr:flagellar motor protein MotA [Methylococcaceae bacterium]
MTVPTRALIWMVSFFVGVALLASTVAPQLAEIFAANPFFNGIILAVLAVGISFNLRQVWLLAREIQWVVWYRRGGGDRAEPHRPRLLAPMARLLGGRDRSRLLLSGHTLRAILDSVQLRLEESRDLSRYLTGLAIFLGLLGTFWGLLVTIHSVTEIIGDLNVGGDAIATFTALKENLRQPLGGMSTSFSTSLFGLASSLIIGFINLQAGQAQNRFYQELEEWLSAMTHTHTSGVAEGETSVPSYLQALLEQTADGLERMQRAIADNERARRDGNRQFVELTAQFDRLNEVLDRDVRERQAAAAVQDELKTVLRLLATHSKRDGSLPEDLRAELRLMSRTIAAALDVREARA